MSNTAKKNRHKVIIFSPHHFAPNACNHFSLIFVGDTCVLACLFFEGGYRLDFSFSLRCKLFGDLIVLLHIQYICLQNIKG